MLGKYQKISVILVSYNSKAISTNSTPLTYLFRIFSTQIKKNISHETNHQDFIYQNISVNKF